MTRFVALMPVAYALGIILGAMLMFGDEGGREQVPVLIKATRPAPTPIKAVPRPPAQIVLETPKEECELLRDREEARLCVQYPLREWILNSLVDRVSVPTYSALYTPRRIHPPPTRQ